MCSSAFVILVILLIGRLAVTKCQGVSDSGAGHGAQMKFATFGDTQVGRFPYMCSLRPNDNRNKHLCGGILVHPSWVLTAAHCLDSSVPGSLGLVPIVYCGIHDIKEDVSSDHVFAAVDGILHEGWTRNATKGYDIALLKLNREANLTLPRLNIPNSRPKPNMSLDALGRGETKGGETADKLQLAENLMAVSHRTCNARWDADLDDALMLCAGIGENDACKGDSGGPLLHADAPGGDVRDGDPQFDLILGIVSFGDGPCGESTRPGVYTDVGYFREWIIGITEVLFSLRSGLTLPQFDFDPLHSLWNFHSHMLCRQGRIPPPPQRSLSPRPSPPSPSPSPSSPQLRLQDIVAAIEEDDSSTLRTALDNGLDPNSRHNDPGVTDGNNDNTLLHWAALFNSPNSAEVLVEFGADLSPKNNISNMPLHYCGFYGSLDVAKVLLSHEVDIDDRGNLGLAALHYAAYGNRIGTIEFLITNGAHINAPDDGGNTPIMWASLSGYVDVVEVLLDNGASKRSRNSSGRSAFDLICIDSSAQCTESERAALRSLLRS